MVRFNSRLDSAGERANKLEENSEGNTQEEVTESEEWKIEERVKDKGTQKGLTYMELEPLKKPENESGAIVE